MIPYYFHFSGKKVLTNKIVSLAIQNIGISYKKKLEYQRFLESRKLII